MGSDKGLMNYCLQLFAIVRECSPVFGLFALFATVLSLYIEQLNSSPLKNPPLRISPSKSEKLGNDQIGPVASSLKNPSKSLYADFREKKAAFRGLGESCVYVAL
jgi:hypothetical protein